MSEFDTERHKVTVTYKGEKRVYYARELGYFEYQDVEEKLGHMPDKTEQDRSKRGIALMRAITVASIEREDGTAALTESVLVKLHKDIAKPLSDAAMLAQGIDMERIRKEAQEAKAAGNVADEEAPAEGNG